MAQSSAGLSSAFTAAFVLLCGLHALLFAAALRLPFSIDKAMEPPVSEEPSPWSAARSPSSDAEPGSSTFACGNTAQQSQCADAGGIPILAGFQVVADIPEGAIVTRIERRRSVIPPS